MDVIEPRRTTRSSSVTPSDAESDKKNERQKRKDVDSPTNDNDSTKLIKEGREGKRSARISLKMKEKKELAEEKEAVAAAAAAEEQAERTSRSRSRGAPKQNRTVIETTHHSDEESDSSLYCLCRTPYDSTRFMIGCDDCNGWFHASCVNMTVHEAQLISNFSCPNCRKKKYAASKAERERAGRKTSRAGDRRGRRKNERKYQQDFESDTDSDGAANENQDEDSDISDSNIYLTSDSEFGEEPEAESVEKPGEPGVKAGRYKSYSYMLNAPGSIRNYPELRACSFNVDVEKLCEQEDDFGVKFSEELIAKNPEISPDVCDIAVLNHLNERRSKVECEALSTVEQKKRLMASALAFARRYTCYRSLDEPLKSVLDCERMQLMTKDHIENHEAAKFIWADILTCQGCLGLIPSDKYYTHVSNCSILSFIKRGGMCLHSGISKKYPKLTVCGCPCYANTDKEYVPESEQEAIEVQSSTATSPSPTSNEIRLSNGIFKKNDTYKVHSSMNKKENGGMKPLGLKRSYSVTSALSNYAEVSFCDVDKEDCAEHIGWEHMWAVEIKCQVHILQRRLHLIDAEIATITRQMEERTEQAKTMETRAKAYMRLVQPLVMRSDDRNQQQQTMQQHIQQQMPENVQNAIYGSMLSHNQQMQMAARQQQQQQQQANMTQHEYNMLQQQQYQQYSHEQQQQQQYMQQEYDKNLMQQQWLHQQQMMQQQQAYAEAQQQQQNMQYQDQEMQAQYEQKLQQYQMQQYHLQQQQAMEFANQHMYGDIQQQQLQMQQQQHLQQQQMQQQLHQQQLHQQQLQQQMQQMVPNFQNIANMSQQQADANPVVPVTTMAMVQKEMSISETEQQQTTIPQ